MIQGSSAFRFSHVVVWITLSVALGGCVSVDANLSYINGTQAIDDGRYDEAITHLTQAVRLDPASARSFNNLAAAYFAAGRTREGWPHVRTAYSLDPRDRTVRANLLRHLGQLIHEGGLKNGSPKPAVLAWLDEPDATAKTADGETWQYGSLGIRFVDDKLAGAMQMDRLSKTARGRPCAVCGSGDSP